MYRIAAFLALILAVNAYPAESSGYTEGSAIKMSDRAKRDIILIEQEGNTIHITDFITDGSSLDGSGLFGSGDASGLFGSGDASGLFGSGDVSDFLEEEEIIRSKRDTSGVEGSGVETSTNATAVTCPALGECYHDDDCHGGTCIGVFIGTCNCNACINFWMCKSDTDCGGLTSACQNGLCDCNGAFTRNNFTTVVDAWTNLCNAKSCKKASMADDCFGLPCNKGVCSC